jgi:hypothetical protein
VYRTRYPDFQSAPVPNRNGQLQRVLPVHEALLQAPRLVAIGLHRIYTDTISAWSHLNLPGNIAADIGPINEED